MTKLATGIYYTIRYTDFKNDQYISTYLQSKHEDFRVVIVNENILLVKSEITDEFWNIGKVKDLWKSTIIEKMTYWLRKEICEFIEVHTFRYIRKEEE